MDSIDKQAEAIRDKEHRNIRVSEMSATTLICVGIAVVVVAIRLVDWIFFGHVLTRSDLYWGAGGIMFVWWGMWLGGRWEEEWSLSQQRLIRIELLLKQHVEKAEDRHSDLLGAVQSISPEEKVYRTGPLPLPK